MIEVTLTGDRALVAKLTELPPRIMAALKRTIYALVINLRTKVMMEGLSGPTGAHTLSVVTGALRRSVKSDVRSDDSSVTGTVSYGADVPYARIHELGGVIHIPEIRPVVAQALHFTWKGEERFFQVVRAHDVVMPERAPLRTVFAGFVPVAKEDLRRAVEGALRP